MLNPAECRKKNTFLQYLIKFSSDAVKKIKNFLEGSSFFSIFD